MKIITSLKFLGTVMAVVAFMLLIKSCKKTDAGAVSPKEAETIKAAAIKAIQEKYGNVSAAVVYNIDKTADGSFYRDTNGNMVPLSGNSSKGIDPNGPNNPNCQYNCSNTTNPANLVVVYTLVAAERYYICESNSDKSSLFIKWTLSAPFTPSLLVQDGALPNTSCTATFTPTSGSTLSYTTAPITSTTNNAQFVAKIIGASSVCISHSLYEITCKIDNIPNGVFSSNWVLSSALTLDVDCGLLGNVSASSLTTAPAFSQNGYLPCNRIDKLYISPQAGSTPTVVIGNAAAICTQPSGWIYITNHQLEYRQVTSSSSWNWSDQTSTVYGNVPIGGGGQTRLLSPFSSGNLTNMVNGSGRWLVRYRNVYNTGGCLDIPGSGFGSGGVSGGNGNWGNSALWITEPINL